MEQFFETLLWRSRLIMLLAVIVALFAATLVILGNFVDLAHLASLFWQYLTNAHNIETRQAMMLAVIELLDGFLMAGVLLIFSFGLYELFISSIEPAQESQQKGKILNIKNIDVLKNKLGKVILMMLIIKVFSFTIQLQVNSALELLMLAAAVALVSVALFLTKDSHASVKTLNNNNNKKGDSHEN